MIARFALGLLLCSIVWSEPTLLEAGFSHMYDLQFDQAHQSFHEWMAQHPEDPMGPVSDAAALLFSELDRLHILQSQLFLDNDEFVNRAKPDPDQNVKQKFDAALARAKQLADRALQRDPRDANAELANLMRLGLDSDYAALIEKRDLAALSEIKTTRALAAKLLSEDPNCYDAYLAGGIENYLLSQKPAPLRWLLRVGGAQTNKDRGIHDLSLTAAHGRYLAPFARVLLAVAALRDRNVSRAKSVRKILAKFQEAFIAFPKDQSVGNECCEQSAGQRHPPGNKI